MMDADKPRYGWGQRVQAAEDLFNDCTYPEQTLGALLVQIGKLGRSYKSESTPIQEPLFTWSSSIAIEWLDAWSLNCCRRNRMEERYEGHDPQKSIRCAFGIYRQEGS